MKKYNTTYIEKSNKMSIPAIEQNRITSFSGITRIYALADTHQEARKTATLLSKVLSDSESGKNILLLHAGDLGKGAYPINLEIDSYIKLKEARPDIEIVMTMGNNDLVFNKKLFGQIFQFLNFLTRKGIKVVSANIFNASGKRIKGVAPYTIVERDGDRNFITGFCIDKLKTQSSNGLISKNQMAVIDEIINAIRKEKPDNVIILNHDYMAESQKIVNYCNQKGINIDLVIGGHDHSQIRPNRDLHIYHPQAYSEAMYKMDLANISGRKKLEDISLVKSSEVTPDKNLIQSIEKYESQNGLLVPTIKSVLNLTKKYSEPSSLGSFLADNMVNIANADIGFLSSGIILRPLNYEQGKFLSKYDIRCTISGNVALRTSELSVKDIKEIFANALKNRGYVPEDSRFLQCSNNIKIIGKNNTLKGCYEIKQICINGQPQLDNYGNPLDKNKKFKCVFDSYIADGVQGFSTLLKKDQNEVFVNGAPLKMGDILESALKDAQSKFQPDSQYPAFIIETVI